MKRGGGTALVLSLLLAGCESPVLWVGTAHSEIGAEAPGDAGVKHASDGAAPTQPMAAEPARAEPDAGGVVRNATNPASPPPSAAGMNAPPPGRTAPWMADPDADAGVGHDPAAPPTPTRFPKINGDCPDLSGPGTYTFRAGSRSLSAQLHMLPKAARSAGSPGPLILYFHAFGTTSAEASTALTQTAIDAVVNQGGVVISFNSVPCLRCGIDDLVWYNEDDAVTDQAVACIRAQASIDPRHIHVAGFSAGALHALHLALARSDFIASVLSYSGGTPTTVVDTQDPTNKVPALLSFGAAGIDNAVADFNVASHDWYNTYHPQGYYVMMCDHGGGHEIPTELPAVALKFFLDHPYRVSPEPYANGVPKDYPKYCNNGP